MFGRIVVSLSCPGFFFVGMFLITDSTSLLVIGLLRFCIGLWLNLGRGIPSVVFLGMCSFKLGYPIIVHSTLLILFISVELVVMLLLSYLILIFWVVSLFFIVHLTKDLLILLIFICCWSFCQSFVDLLTCCFCFIEFFLLFFYSLFISALTFIILSLLYYFTTS